MSGEDYFALSRLVTFRPLERPLLAHGAMHSQFKAPWRSTVRLLTRELDLHGARAAVLEMDFRESDLRQDGLPRAARNARSAGIVLSFQAMRVVGHPQLRYEVTTFVDWRDNVRGVALALEALRAVDRYGVTRRGEQYAGWKQLEAAVGEGNAAHGRELIEDAGSLAEALKRAHPDHGGAPEDFRDVIAARDADQAR
jgi:hypothetical protein